MKSGEGEKREQTNPPPRWRLSFFSCLSTSGMSFRTKNQKNWKIHILEIKDGGGSKK